VARLWPDKSGSQHGICLVWPRLFAISGTVGVPESRFEDSGRLGL